MHHLVRSGLKSSILPSEACAGYNSLKVLLRGLFSSLQPLSEHRGQKCVSYLPEEPFLKADAQLLPHYQHSGHVQVASPRTSKNGKTSIQSPNLPAWSLGRQPRGLHTSAIVKDLVAREGTAVRDTESYEGSQDRESSPDPGMSLQAFDSALNSGLSDSEDEGLRVVALPLIHPKASVTSDHHPCGGELLEFPFSAKAFYIGKDRKDLLRKLRKHAKSQGWQQVHYNNGSSLYCLRKSKLPFNEQEDYTGLPCEKYILTLNRLDSVVFFNGGNNERELWKKYTGSELTEQYIEEVRVSVIPNLDMHNKLFSDRIVLQQAQLDELRTIAYVMGQTVSLHYYEMGVDQMLRKFNQMNQEMAASGSWKTVAKKKDLLQMVAKNNLLFTDIVSKLGIMERFDLAWKNTQCSDIYEHLRSDMEITNRNSNLQIKLQLVSENVKYLLELMQNEKSDFLEWIIIILIAAEIVISLSDMAHKFT